MGRFVILISLLPLFGCARNENGTTKPTAAQDAEGSQGGPTAAATEAPSPVVAASASLSPAPVLDPSRGREIGLMAEAFLSPYQESDEEENTPSSTPQMFRSTTPSMSRAQREAAGHRAHGQIRFTKDLSRAFIDVRVEGVNVATVNMFHIHCGKPGILGPILIDFSLATDIQKNLADGLFSIEVTDDLIVKTAEHGHSMIDAFTMGCIIPSASLGSIKPVKVSTVAGVAQLVLDGELYFNLHTTGQTYYGDIRGQIHPIEKVNRQASGGEAAK